MEHNKTDHDTKKIEKPVLPPVLKNAKPSGNILLDNPRTQEFILSQPLYEGFSIEQLLNIGDYLREQNFAANEYVITENQPGKDIFFIEEGEVNVLKKVDNTEEEIVLKTFGNGDYFGEIAMLDSRPRSASIRTTKPSVLVVLSKDNMDRMEKERPELYTKFLKNLARRLGNHLRHVSEDVVEGYKIKLEKEKLRVGMSNFFCGAILIFASYGFLLRGSLEAFSEFLSSRMITCFCAFFFGIALLYLMKKSGYPMSSYGLTLKNWKKDSVYAFLITLPFLLLIVVAKWFYLDYFDLNSSVITFEFFKKHSSGTLFLILFVYTLFIPAQEVVFRGGFQGSLHHFLTGKRANAWTVVASSIMFATAHLHISLALAFLTIFPGLFWGFMFNKQRSLVGVIISHIMVGWFAFLVVEGF